MGFILQSIYIFIRKFAVLAFCKFSKYEQFIKLRKTIFKVQNYVLKNIYIPFVTDNVSSLFITDIPYIFNNTYIR